jgi:hypothetical protein
MNFNFKKLAKKEGLGMVLGYQAKGGYELKANFCL